MERLGGHVCHSHLSGHLHSLCQHEVGVVSLQRKFPHVYHCLFFHKVFASAACANLHVAAVIAVDVKRRGEITAAVKTDGLGETSA